MSDIGGGSLGTATFYITGDASGASNAASQANNALASLEQTVATNWWGIRNLGLVFAALPAAVTAGAAAAVKSASEIQDAMVGIARTANLMGKENEGALSALQAQLYSIASVRATPTIEVLGIAESAGALGVATENIAAFTKVVVDLVSTTDLTASAASVGLARLAALTGTTASGYESLASSIMTVGVATAATETDILSLAQRLAGTGAALGLTSDQIIGWSAAILSAGIRTAEGATQIQKTFIDISRAVSKGGSDLQAWANIANMSAEEFKAAFDESASTGLLDVVTGLGNIIEQGGDFVAFLDAAGVTEQRQVRNLLLLAAAQAQTANENVKASRILEIANTGLQDHTFYLDAVAARNATFSARLQQLQNTLTQTGATLGNAFLGPLTRGIDILQTFTLGIGNLHGPIKALTLAVFGFATVGSALIAFFLLFGARIIIAWSALKRIREGLSETSAATSGLAGAQKQATMTGQEYLANLDRQAQALQRQEQAARRAQATLGANLLGLMGAPGATKELGNETMILGVRQQQTAQKTTFLQSALRNLGRAAQLTTALMVGLTVYTFALGRAQQRLEEQTQNARKAHDEVTEAMRRSGSAVNDQTQAALQQIPAYQSVMASARQLGVEQQALNTILNTASPQEYQQFIDAVANANGKGSDSYKQIINDAFNLRESFKASGASAGIAIGPIQQENKALEELQRQAGKTTEELEAFRQKQIEIANAVVAVVDAAIASEMADLDLRDAERKLNEARTEAANIAARTHEAELRVQSDRLAVEEATRKVAEAEDALAHARENAQNDVLDAENSLADARDDYADSLDNITEKEQALADLQEESAERADKLRDATNKLNDARLRLRKSTLEVSDLEQNLAYLQQQGAGARDIEEAQLALAQAKQDVADANDAVLDGEKDLSDLTDPVKQAQAREKAERELAAARRDSAASLRTITDRERELATARQNLANDTAYKDAEKDLVDAQLSEQDAIRQLQTDELELQRIRSGGLQDDAKRAELEYEQQVLNTAKAHVELQKQTALSNGETWDAQRAALALKDELGNLNVVTQEAIDKRKQWMDELAKAPAIPAKGDGGASIGDPSDFSPEAAAGGGGSEFGLPEGAVEEAKASFMDALAGIVSGGGLFLGVELAKMLGRSIKGRFATQAGAELGETVIGSMAGGIGAGGPAIGTEMAVATGEGAATAGTLMPAIMAALPYIIVGLIIAGLVALLIKDGNWKKVWNAIVDGLSAAKDWVVDHWKEILLSVLLGPLYLIHEGLKQFGIDVPAKVWEGIQAGIGALADFATLIFNNTVGKIPGIASWLLNKGIELLRGLATGAVQGMANVASFFLGLPGQIMGYVAGAASWLIGAGSNIIVGLVNGVTTGAYQLFNWFTQTLPDGIWNALESLWGGVSAMGGAMFEAGKNIVIGLWNGLLSMGSWLWDQVTSFISDHIPGPVKFILGIDSPSKVMAALGRWAGIGIGEGLLGTEDLIKKASETIARAAVPEIPPIDVEMMRKTGLDQLTADPFIGLSMNPGVYNAGAPVTNNYYETLDLDVESNADPEQIVNEYVWAKRVRSRS